MNPRSNLKPVDHWHIKTPWDSQPIIWRTPPPHDRYLDLTAGVDSLATHLVREVRFIAPERSKRLSAWYMRSVVRRADAELHELRAHGIKVAETKWHIFTDDEKNVRTLARVAIIDGFTMFNPRDDTERALQKTEVALWKERLESYVDANDTKWMLDDIHDYSQYVIGVPRGSDPTIKPEPYLVDIEPILRRR